MQKQQGGEKKQALHICCVHYQPANKMYTTLIAYAANENIRHIALCVNA